MTETIIKFEHGEVVYDRETCSFTITGYDGVTTVFGAIAAGRMAKAILVKLEALAMEGLEGEE